MLVSRGARGGGPAVGGAALESGAVSLDARCPEARPRFSSLELGAIVKLADGRTRPLSNTNCRAVCPRSLSPRCTARSRPPNQADGLESDRCR